MLARKLPEYMIPMLVVLEALPLGANGGAARGAPVAAVEFCSRKRRTKRAHTARGRLVFDLG